MVTIKGVKKIATEYYYYIIYIFFIDIYKSINIVTSSPMALNIELFGDDELFLSSRYRHFVTYVII